MSEEQYICEPWKRQPLLERLHSCKFMLQLHGLMTDREAHTIMKRLKKLAAKQSQKGREA